MDLLRGLPEMSIHGMSAVRKQRVLELATAIGPVQWEHPTEPKVSAVEFHALGLEPHRGPSPLMQSLQGSRHLIVSPFVTAQALEEITTGSGQVTLISRPATLEALGSELLADISTYILNPAADLADADDGEEIAPPGEAESAPSAGRGRLGGLHAKVYVAERGNQTRLFVGSANATAAGLRGRNVEFVIEFQGSRASMGIDTFISPDLSKLSEFQKLLAEYTPLGDVVVDEDEEAIGELDRTLRSFAQIPVTSTITEIDGRYVQTVRSAEELVVPASTEVTLALFSRPVEGRPFVGGRDLGNFTDLDITEISGFLILCAVSGKGAHRVERSTLLRMRLVNEPERRLDEILAQQFKEPGDFLRFLALLLGLDSVGSSPVDGLGVSGFTWPVGTGAPGLFESLVQVVAVNPSVIDDLDRLIDCLLSTDRGRSMLPEGFDRLWSTIREVRPKSRRRA